MTCEKIQENISLYLDGILDEEERKKLEQHINECDQCALEFTHMLDIMDMLHSIPQKDVPHKFHKELIKKIDQVNNSSSDNKKNKILRSLKPIAAVFLLLLFIGTSAILILTPMGRMSKSIRNDSAPQEMIESKAENTVTSESYDREVTFDTEESKLSESSRSFSEIGSLQGQKIIKTASLSLEVEEFDSVIQDIRQLVESNGGYVASAETYIYSSNYEKKEYLKEGHMKIRIPSEKYGTAQQQLIEMGHLKHQSENSENITEQYIDTQSRIRMLKVQEERLLAIMEQATKVEDLIKLEQRLNEVRTDLEVFQGRIQNWDQLVTFSTIEIQIRQIKKASLQTVSPNFTVKMKDGFIDSINHAQSSIERFLIKIARHFIQIIFGILLALIGIWTIRVIYKKIKMKGE
ncbi:MAG: DUF4349 domain-containing protein [Epulopiscium sp.]|nr:DUF4349 domain-containing protein [Candidatus Epulonipiscium sp.]